MNVEVLETADAVALKAASFIAAAARQAVGERGSFVLAVSGGRTPWAMLRALVAEDLPWKQVQIVQVDERIAPPGDPDRNLTHLLESLRGAPLPAAQIHAMPVEAADPAAAAIQYAKFLESIVGTPAKIDLVHLGLGPDGHTASLVPGDAVLEVADADVALTGEYQKRRRMTLTYPILNRARQILWVVTGGDKVDPLKRLRLSDPSIPAGRVSQSHAIVIADRSAAGT